MASMALYVSPLCGGMDQVVTCLIKIVFFNWFSHVNSARLLIGPVSAYTVYAVLADMVHIGIQSETGISMFTTDLFIYLTFMPICTWTDVILYSTHINTHTLCTKRAWPPKFIACWCFISIRRRLSIIVHNRLAPSGHTFDLRSKTSTRISIHK